MADYYVPPVSSIAMLASETAGILRVRLYVVLIVINATLFVASVCGQQQPVPGINTVNKDGEPVGVTQLSRWLDEGKTIAISFWNTRCASCIGQLPRYNYLANKYRKNGFIWLWINDGQTKDDVPSGIWEKCAAMVVLFDVNGDTRKAFDNPAWGPTRIVNSGNGVIWYGESYELCESLLSGMLLTGKGEARKSVSYKVKSDSYEITITTATKIGGSRSTVGDYLIRQQATNPYYFLVLLTKIVYEPESEIEILYKPECMSAYDIEVRMSASYKPETAIIHALKEYCRIFNIGIAATDRGATRKITYNMSGYADI